MFIVKEYVKETDDYIGHTAFLNNNDAINFSKRILKYQSYLKVIVTEIDYNNIGEIWEMIVWESEKKGYN